MVAACSGSVTDFEVCPVVEFNKIIGKRIEKGRRRKGLLQHELAAAVGRSESWVGQVQHRETLRRVTELHHGLRTHKTAGTRSLGEHVIDTRSLLKTTGSVA